MGRLREESYSIPDIGLPSCLGFLFLSLIEGHGIESDDKTGSYYHEVDVHGLVHSGNVEEEQDEHGEEPDGENDSEND